MNQRLGLFASQAFKRLIKAPSSRKLYTDQIDPYPHKYFREEKFPQTECYRENWDYPKGFDVTITRGIWMMRLFWAYFFWNLFHDPAAIWGHATFPDPSKWTDEELGIPPLDAGSYREWAEKQIKDE